MSDPKEGIMSNPLAVPTNTPRAAHAHRLVAETARDLAYVMYDELMCQNKFYQHVRSTYPNLDDTQRRERFARQLVPRMIEPARATLAAMLNGPYDESLKETIAQALMLDKTLKRGRQAAGAS